MTARNVWIAGILALALLCMAGAAAADETIGNATGEFVIVDDVEPYDGPIGPGSPLYGLKIAFEDLDESFTANETERFNKQLNHARLRLSEVRRELLMNNTDAAERALELYEAKLNTTQLQLQVMASSNATGLLHAQQIVARHQLVLGTLLDENPGNRGLQRAYNNSVTLEQKFEEKTQTRIERVVQKNNATIAKAVRLAEKTQQHTNNTGEEQAIKVQQTEKVQQGQGAGGNDDKGQKQVTQTPANDNGQKGNKNQ
ncbi:MAG: hypothetical protein APR53_02900 [Methanoculleus sp. SDB]|nr:MAG: hypothetical protein APR53_02900 [Methanoculleus sp. SDB]